MSILDKKTLVEDVQLSKSEERQKKNRFKQKKARELRSVLNSQKRRKRQKSKKKRV